MQENRGRQLTVQLTQEVQEQLQAAAGLIGMELDLFVVHSSGSNSLQSFND